MWCSGMLKCDSSRVIHTYTYRSQMSILHMQHAHIHNRHNIELEDLMLHFVQILREVLYTWWYIKIFIYL